MKKALIVIGLLLIVLLTGYYYLYHIKPASLRADAFDAIPQDVSLVIEIQNASTLIEELQAQPYGNDLMRAGFLSRFSGDISAIRNLLNNEQFSEINEALEGKITASLHITAAENYGFSYFIPVILAGGTSDVEAALNQAELQFHKRVFREILFFDIQVDGSSSPITVTYLRGLIIASFHGFLVEESVSVLLQENALSQLQNFHQIRSLSKSEPNLRMLIQLNQFASLAPLITIPQHKNIFNRISGLADWVGFEFIHQENGLLFNGFATAGTGKVLSLHQNEAPDAITITEFIPSEAALFLSYGTGNYSDFLNQPELVESKNPISRYFDWVSREWAWGLLETPGNDLDEGTFLVIKTVNPEAAIQNLDELVRVQSEEDEPAAEPVSWNDFQFRQLNIDTALNSIFPQQLLRLNNPWFVVSGNAVYFANTTSTLRQLLQAHQENQVLSRTSNYLTFTGNLSSYSNLYVYVNSRRLFPYIEQVVRPVLRDAMQQNQALAKFWPAAIQFNNHRDFFFVNGFIGYQEQVTEELKLLWTVQLDAPAVGQTAFVRNHETDEQEVIVQDEQNQVYLIGSNGKILWKSFLDEPIVGDVAQIDFFRNGKLQYLFNTRNFIYMLDRLGRNVAQFPIRLPAPATAPLSIVRYNDQDDFRIFIPAENGNLYGYERGGKPLPGWSPRSGVGNIPFRLQHVLVEGWDYLITTNTSGEVHFFDRRAESRIPAIQLERPLVQEQFIRSDSRNFMLMGADSAGTIHQVSRDGTVATFALPDSPAVHQFFYISTDDDELFLTRSSTHLRAHNRQMQQQFNFAFPSAVEQNGKIIYVDGQPAFSFVSTTGEIYLLDRSGTMMDFFPVRGTALPAVHGRKDQREKMLSVANGRDVILYRWIY